MIGKANSINSTSQNRQKTTYDVIIIGGGAIGSAVGYGIARKGLSVAILDGEDGAFRAARGNAGLVWFQRKGLGSQPYVDLTLTSAKMWESFGKDLEDRTGINLDYEKTGGVDVYFTEKDLEQAKQDMAQLKRQSIKNNYECEILNHSELQSLFPKLKIGDSVLGASFSRHDGQVYPLAMLKALHKGFQSLGGHYLPGRQVVGLSKLECDFEVKTKTERFVAPKLILAAGLGIPKLAAMLDQTVKLMPERGQILVTQKIDPILPHVFGDIRQTPAGNLLLGSTNEAVGYDDRVTVDGAQGIAKNFYRTLPDLKNLGIIRMWGALRILTSDRLPIYHEAQDHPGLFMLTSHSAITLASTNAEILPDWIVNGDKPDIIKAFDNDRFNDVPKEASCSVS